MGKTSASMAYGLSTLPLLHPEWHLQRIEEAFGGALTTERNSFISLPACGIGNLGWTTNQACLMLSRDSSEQAHAWVVDRSLSHGYNIPYAKSLSAETLVVLINRAK